MELGNSLLPAEALLAVKPGDEVAVEVGIDPSIQITEEVRKSLIDKANSAMRPGREHTKIVVIGPGRALTAEAYLSDDRLSFPGAEANGRS
jgi:antitoxin component of MazEF toxin-antitoxin module